MKAKTGKRPTRLLYSFLILLCGAAAVFVTMRSLVSPAFFRPHDSTHAARLVEMRRSLQAGEFPVRWSRNFGFGYGMPLFNFYAPLPYYLGQLPLALGFSAIDAIKFLYFVNGVLAFVGMYLFARKLWGKAGGLIAALVFSFASYRALDLFVRGALGEAFALVFIPFALYGIQLFLDNHKWGIVVVSLSLVAILTSHNLTGLATVVLLSVYWLLQVLLRRGREWHWQLMALVIGFGLALGLSAFYVFPAFFEKGLTRVDQTITVGYFDYHNHFLCWSQLFRGQWKYGASLPGCSDDLSFSFGAVAWILVAAAVVSIIWRGNKREKLTSTVIIGGLLFSLFLTLGRSSFIWDRLSLLKYFQFPWRFLTFAHVFFAALTGGLILAIRRWWYFLLPVGVGLVALIWIHAQYYLPEQLQLPSALTEWYNTSPTWIQSEISKTLSDYLPPKVRDDALPEPVSSRFTVPAGQVKVLDDRSNLASVQIICAKDCFVKVNVFEFPAWTANVDGKPEKLMPTDSNLPIYSLLVPAGTHTVTLKFVGTPLEQASNLVTLLTLLIALVGLLPLLRRKVLS